MICCYHQYYTGNRSWIQAPIKTTQNRTWITPDGITRVIRNYAEAKNKYMRG